MVAASGVLGDQRRTNPTTRSSSTQRRNIVVRTSSRRP
jgi:hypothetical protein